MVRVVTCNLNQLPSADLIDSVSGWSYADLEHQSGTIGTGVSLMSESRQKTTDQKIPGKITRKRKKRTKTR